MHWLTRATKKWKRMKAVLIFFLCTLAVGAILFSSCSGAGICVGSGGSILLSPVCKEGWTSDECAEWDAQGISDANWNYYSGTCADQGYTERCSDGSYRYPGAC